MRAARVALALLPLLIAACGGEPVRPENPASTRPAAPAVKPPDHGDPQARFDAALTQMKNGDAQGAEDAFKALTGDFPQYAGPWTNLGILEAKAKKRDAAIAAFTRAAQIDPNNVVAFNWLGILNREAGDYARAKLAYEKGLAVAPDDALTRLNYAILLDEYLKQPQAALEQYKQYLSTSKKEDLRVTAWVAELEARTKVTTAPPAAAAPSGTTP
ncbi:tetratricopeptide repeat protein [Solimonas terrae]|uniref:Tetratricopeptide repeat protein n=2 Tax=Solimonas terrae TaxID=1396819 RepID=A0A6M2BNE4_9GAMM|nr:tetratricopeptide repeat protein [Solimonas terrae]